MEISAFDFSTIVEVLQQLDPRHADAERAAFWERIGRFAATDAERITIERVSNEHAGYTFGFGEDSVTLSTVPDAKELELTLKDSQAADDQHHVVIAVRPTAEPASPYTLGLDLLTRVATELLELMNKK